MGSRKRHPASYISKAVPERKRSYEAPLLALGALVVIGYPLLRDATADRMARNTYANAASCHCAYSPSQCSQSNGRWIGPWYAVASKDRDATDPGEGRHCSRSTGGGAYLYSRYPSPDDPAPRTGVERGYRGGFGATGRVRAAGS